MSSQANSSRKRRTDKALLASLLRALSRPHHLRGERQRKLARRSRAVPETSVVKEPIPCQSTPKRSARPTSPSLYAVGREKIREYARAVGETNPVHLDVEAARAAGYADVVAPPMFAVVYSAPVGRAADLRPRDRAQLRDDGPRRPGVRVGRRRSWPATRSPPRRASRTSPKRDGRGYYVFESVSTNQRGEQVCRGTWTNIVRGV